MPILTTGAGGYPVAGGGGGGNVTFDATGALGVSAAGPTVGYTGLTVGSANGLLATILYSGFGTVSITSVVWDSAGTPQNLSFIGGITNPGNVRIEFWGLVAAPVTSGNKTLTVTQNTAGSVMRISACSYSGVNAASVAAAFKNFNSNSTAAGSSTTVAVTVTSATGHEVVASTMTGPNASVVSITGTQIFLNNSGTIVGAGSRTAGAASVTPTATYDMNTDPLVIIGVDVSP
jgi:hypothetical protein